MNYLVGYILKAVTWERERERERESERERKGERDWKYKGKSRDEEGLPIRTQEIVKKIFMKNERESERERENEREREREREKKDREANLCPYELNETTFQRISVFTVWAKPESPTAYGNRSVIY